MAANHPSDAFEAWCSVIHNPPDPPQLGEGSWGFSAVTLDTSFLPEGVYLLTLDPPLDISKICVHGDYKATPPFPDFGVFFDGKIDGLVPASNQICLIRFQVVPGNILKNGPFTVSVSAVQ